VTMLSSTERDAIHDWIVAVSGLAATSVVWADQRAPQAPVGIYIELRASEPVPFGEDWDDIEEVDGAPAAPALNLRHQMRGVRVSLLEIACYPHGAKWSEARPAWRLNQILAGRNLPLRAQALRTGGIGFGRPGKIMDLNLERSTIFEPRSIVEIPMHLLSEVTELGNSIDRVEVEIGIGHGAADQLEDQIAFDDLVVTADEDDDTLAAVAHGLRTGDGPVRIATDDTLPAPLLVATDYWVIRVSANAIRLASTRALATAGTALDLTDEGDGTHTLSDRPDTTRVIFEVAAEE